MLRRGGPVCVRPDTAWHPPILGEPATRLLEANPESDGIAPSPERLMTRYDFAAHVQDYSVFTSRCDGTFVPDPAQTIEENIVALIEEANRGVCAVMLNNAAQMAVFSRNSISDVVFLVRHPVDTYLSFADPKRHGDIVEALGGFDSEEALRARADVWNRRAEEFLRCRELGLSPVLIRHEFAANDAATSSGLKAIFADNVAQPPKQAPRHISERLAELTSDPMDSSTTAGTQDGLQADRRGSAWAKGAKFQPYAELIISINRSLETPTSRACSTMPSTADVSSMTPISIGSDTRVPRPTRDVTTPSSASCR